MLRRSTRGARSKSANVASMDLSAFRVRTFPVHRFATRESVHANVMYDARAEAEACGASGANDVQTGAAKQTQCAKGACERRRQMSVSAHRIRGTRRVRQRRP